MLGEALSPLELAQRLDGADRLVGERAQRLQLLAAREHVVGRVVDPYQAVDRAVAVVQRHDQPVVVPGVRAAAVAQRRVDALEVGRADDRGLGVEDDAAFCASAGSISGAISATGRLGTPRRSRASSRRSRAAPAARRLVEGEP